jgi:hypothetical protein
MVLVLDVNANSHRRKSVMLAPTVRIEADEVPLKTSEPDLNSNIRTQ